MNILKSDTEYISVATRSFNTPLTVNVTEESTGVTQSFSATLLEGENYHSLDIRNMEYTENKFYMMDLVNSDGDTIFKGKLFATDQEDLANYTINKDRYKQGNSQINTKNNYKFYEQS